MPVIYDTQFNKTYINPLERKLGGKLYLGKNLDYYQPAWRNFGEYNYTLGGTLRFKARRGSLQQDIQKTDSVADEIMQTAMPPNIGKDANKQAHTNENKIQQLLLPNIIKDTIKQRTKDSITGAGFKIISNYK